VLIDDVDGRSRDMTDLADRHEKHWYEVRCDALEIDWKQRVNQDYDMNTGELA